MVEGGGPDRTTELRIAVTPFFNLAATMSFIDPFRAANYLEGTTRFRWQLVSEAGGMVTASNGVEVNTARFSEAGMNKADMLFVSSSWEPERHVSAALRANLRNAAKRQAILGGLDTGAFVLAYAGLLENYTATVHYEHIDAFQELFPKTGISEALWVIDRRRVTCSGGAASLDLALHLIQQSHGSALANAAARYVFAPRYAPTGHCSTPRIPSLWATPFQQMCVPQFVSWRQTLKRHSPLRRFAGMSGYRIGNLIGSLRNACEKHQHFTTAISASTGPAAL